MENWRNDIEAIANKLAESLGGNWRNDLKVIREAVEAGGGGGTGGATNATQLDTKDTNGLLGTPAAMVKLQPLVDEITKRVMTELLTIAAFNTHKTSGDHDARYHKKGDNIDLEGNSYIINVPDPTGGTDVASWQAVTAETMRVQTKGKNDLNAHKNSGDHDSRYIKAGNDIDMGLLKITSLGAPTADNDAATKAYVDSSAGGGATNINDEHGFVNGNPNSEQPLATMVNKIAAQTLFAKFEHVGFSHTGTIAPGAAAWIEKTWTRSHTPILWVQGCPAGLSISIDLLDSNSCTLVATNIGTEPVENPYIGCMVAELQYPTD